MKKFLQSKGFKVTTLSVCCIGVLAACFFFGRDRFEKFTPDSQLPEGAVNEWEEPTGIPEPADGDAAAYSTAKDAVKQESYPKIVDENEDKTVVDFAPTADASATETPKRPVAQGDNTNPKVTPTYQPEDLEVPDTNGEDKSTGGTPSAGDKNEKGEYYVPGFGWTAPSTVEQIEMDNDGDPNKQVGNM